MADQLTPLGRFLEDARKRKRLSMRAAARAAGFSDGRWRQVITGIQKHGHGITSPTNAPAETVVALAQAVGADVRQAVELAGYDPEEVLPNPPTIDKGLVLAEMKTLMAKLEEPDAGEAELDRIDELIRQLRHPDTRPA